MSWAVLSSLTQYIDPRTRPWDHMTDDIYQYMKAEWECSVATVPVADTEANRIKEYRAVTAVSVSKNTTILL